MNGKMEYSYVAYRSPLGVVYLLASDRGLIALSLGENFQDFKERHRRRAPGLWKKVKAQDDKILGRAVRSLDAYFNEGYHLSADIPLDLVGTPFQLKVWKELRKIPYGKTRSYGQIAKRIGKPQAARAVGRACGTNPISLFVPCHRVVGAGGSLVGFGGGVDLKEQLLTLEEIS